MCLCAYVFWTAALAIQISPCVSVFFGFVLFFARACVCISIMYIHTSVLFHA